jgi:hypothetical protein
MINVPKQFQPQINTVYPPHNYTEFERWFFENYEGDVSDREYLPIFFTGFYVNNNYGNDKAALSELQSYIDALDKSKKYFVICQYDDSILNDLSGLDVYQFNMSRQWDYPLPLIGQPHPYVFNEEKKYLANFVGNITHPIREHAKTLQGKEGYYISFDRHSPEEYCRVIAQSYFTLCYRGYGINSFRIAEAMQYGSIPVYISDNFMLPHNIPFYAYGIKIEQNELSQLHKRLSDVLEWMGKEGNENYYPNNIREFYKGAFTYEGTKNKILNHLKNGVD